MNIRELLKTETATLHRELEAKLDIMSPSLTRELYSNLIARLYSYYSAIESALTKIDLPEALEWSKRKKVSLLKDDLKALGLPEQIQKFEIPTLKTQAEALGALYVLEGSSLGAQIISKHFREHLGIDHNSGGKYYGGYQQDTGVMWRKFIAVLDEAIMTDQQREEALKAAKATFCTLGDCMKLSDSN